jgi:hypothetical protein
MENMLTFSPLSVLISQIARSVLCKLLLCECAQPENIPYRASITWSAQPRSVYPHLAFISLIIQPTYNAHNLLRDICEVSHEPRWKTPLVRLIPWYMEKIELFLRGKKLRRSAAPSSRHWKQETKLSQRRLWHLHGTSLWYEIAKYQCPCVWTKTLIALILSRVWVIIDEVWIGNWIYIRLTGQIRVMLSLFYTLHKVFSVCYIFTSRCVVTDPNSVLCFRFHGITGWRLSHKLIQSSKFNVTLRLTIYRQSVRVGGKPLEAHEQRFFFRNWTHSVIVLK